jgi:hypothetical protein
MIQGNLKKISLATRVFRHWAEAKGLRASETRYVRHTRGGLIDLQFSKSGAPAIDKAYRTHYVSPELSERKQQKLEERLGHAPQPVVFAILRESRCSECGTELTQGDFLYMEAGQPLCLACANMGDLEFLPAGDTALTRRAGKDSVRSAVVVRFSRSRGRYERQGILVEPSALERAERECTEDAEARARQRSRAASQRAEQDRELVASMTEQIRLLFPGCPANEARAVAVCTPPCAAAAGWAGPRPAATWTSRRCRPPWPPRYGIGTRSTTSSWRAGWIAHWHASAWAIGCVRFWRRGESERHFRFIGLIAI